MVIQTQYGKIKGYNRDGCNIYLGIPFAKPPVGELAFKHPLPPEPWTDVRDANKGSANPIQAPGTFSIGNNSQDCLYLNVFVPEKAEGPLPVMVWIYGGAYNQGGAGTEEKETDVLLYDMASYANETGCIVVTFNYRLNIYGFLNLSHMGPDFDINNGLFDQIMALKFVRDNISEFGGDPDNVTLFGQSAGGACTLALMSMEEAEGLFHKVIVQSACIDHFFTVKESEKYTKAYLKIAGAKTAQDVMSLDEEAIWKANKEFASWIMKKGEMRVAFSPVIDGTFLKDAPKNVVKKSKLPMLTGTVKDEGSIFVPAVSDTALAIGFKFLKIKVEKGPGTFRERAVETITNHDFVQPMLEILDEYSGPAWRYKYQYIFPGSPAGIGCYHSCEVPVLFGSRTRNVNDPETKKISSIMRSVWGRFAREGAPGWSEYKEDGEVFVIG